MSVATTMPARLEELAAQFDDLPRQDRIDLLIEFANALPAVPEHLRSDESRRLPVHECLTPTWVYVERDGELPLFWVEVAESAPTIKAVAAILIEGCEGASREEILAVPEDLPVRIIGPEMVGQRRFGLAALVGHIKRAVATV